MLKACPSPVIFGLFVLAIVPVSAFAGKTDSVRGQIYCEVVAQHTLPEQTSISLKFSQFHQTAFDQEAE